MRATCFTVFPARAGMSRVVMVFGAAKWGVPRASGDEPNPTPPSKITLPCSPRERG